jgi:hypothetical protein
VSEKQRFAVRESVEIWDERSGSLLAHAVSGDRAILIVAALNAAYDRPAEPKPQESATSTYHVYGSHDLVNQTLCYKVRRRDAEGVDYLVATFDDIDAAIKERDRLNVQAKAESKAQASNAPANWHSIAGVVNANSKSVKFCVNCQTPDGRLFTVSEWDKREDALAERDRLNAEAKAAPQPTAADPVDAPDHYRQGEIECIDAVKAMLGAEGFAYWLRGNIVAYLWRLPHKGEAKKDAGKTRNLAERLERLLAE